MREDIQTILMQCDDLISQGFDKDELLIKLEIDKMSRENRSKTFIYLDGRMAALELNKQYKSRQSVQMAIGVIISLLGFFITIVTFVSGHSKFVLAYGLILSGAWLVRDGYKKSQAGLEMSKGRRIRKPKRKW